MGTNTLTDRASGQTILDTFFNDIHTSLNGDFVGRSSGGVATSGQNLGTNALPWGSAYITNLILNGDAVDTSLLTAPKNRIVSGKTRSASNQPQFIDPNGAAASFILEGATTNLVVDINGATVQAITDITKSSLTVGPSTTATCTIAESSAADQDSTRTWGEKYAELETIGVGSMGAEMQAFIGQYQAIKIEGVSTEYALAYIESTVLLSDIHRGFFYDSSGNPVNRTAFSNSDTITVLSTGWVFLENDGATVDVSYKTPIRSYTAPSSPATGDYWYDMANETWKRYDGSSFQIINRTLVGIVAIDSSNCVAARSFDFYQKFSKTNTAEMEVSTTEIVQMRNENAVVNVYGNELSFGFNHESWNITTDLASATDMYDSSEQASTTYYAYLADTGETIISDIEPYNRPDLLGFYHPHNPWRCIAVMYNDSGSDIILCDEVRYNPNIESKEVVYYDQKTGADGGASSANTVQIRTLNSREGDDSDFTSIASNQPRLIKGEYLIDASAPGFATNNHQLFLYDVDGTAYLITGEDAYADNTNLASNRATIQRRLLVNDYYRLELRHYTKAAQASNGLGVSASGETGNPATLDIYSILKIKKIN
jgi:hypothetical protein